MNQEPLTAYVHAAAYKAARAGFKACAESNKGTSTDAALDGSSVSLIRGTGAIPVNTFRRYSSDMATNESQLPRRAADSTCSSVMPQQRRSGNGVLQTVIRYPGAPCLPTRPHWLWSRWVQVQV